MRILENPVIKTGEVFHVVLDPTRGSEQAGFRYCVVVSPNSINENLNCVMVVPLSKALKKWPTRVRTTFLGVDGNAICEQLRTIDKSRLKQHAGTLSTFEIEEIKYVLRTMFTD
jgi:mRNA interferase MazF